MLYPLEVAFCRVYMIVFRFVSWLLPFRQPELFTGPDSSLQMCDAIAKEGIKNILIVTDAMLVQLGLLDAIEARLSERGIHYHVYDGVKPDPTIEQVENGVALLKQINAQAVLAIGGGSSIDAAKIIAARATNNKDVAKMAGLFRVFRRPMRLYAIPTTAGTGSECTVAAVISDPEQQRKLPIIDLKLVPWIACLDAKLMVGLPQPITAATGMDALTHAVEAYISRGHLKRTDEWALKATQLIMENLPTAYADGSNLEARQNMAQASYLAGNAFTQAGVGYVHAIAHNFGARYHTPHGLANAIVMPYVLEYSKQNCIGRLADLARASGISGSSDAQLADAFIGKIKAMNKAFDIPEKLDVLKREDIPQIAVAARNEARFTYAVPRYMSTPVCEGVIGQILV